MMLGEKSINWFFCNLKKRGMFLLSVLICLAILCSASVGVISANAVEDEWSTIDFKSALSLALEINASEEKVYSSIKNYDSFADDSVLIVYNAKNTFDLDSNSFIKNHNADRFSEIGASNVIDLTENISKRVSNEINDIMNDFVVNKDLYEKKGDLTDLFKSNSCFERIKRFRKIVKIKLSNSNKKKVVETIKILEKRPDILYVGPDYYETLFSTPNDCYYANQWALDRIDLPLVWDLTTGNDFYSNNQVVVGVIDSGIESTHNDLINNIDTNLCMDFTSGFPEEDDHPTDSEGHGTKVAGIIGASGNNSLGITGVCWNIKMASLKVRDEEIDPYGISDVAMAVDYADGMSIPIINYSGGSADPVNDDYMRYYVISNYFGLFVCAVGNYADNIPVYPAYYNYYLDNVVSVGASDSNDEIAWFSNYGEGVDIFAPGVGIKTTAINNTYFENFSGTSASAAFVTGTAALLLSFNPSLSPSELKERLLLTAEQVDYSCDLMHWTPFYGYCTSNGRLNVANAFGIVQFHINCKVGNKWVLWVSNTTPDFITIVYNKKMCNDLDAALWSGLSDIAVAVLAPGDTSIEIQENGTACFVAISNLFYGDRIITYANNLNVNGFFTPYASSVPIAAYSYYLNGAIFAQIILLGKDGSDWIIKVTNISSVSKILEYNSLMCFESDAKLWQNLNNLSSTIVSAGGSVNIRISENYFADYIALSFKDANSRMIIYANQINTNCTLSHLDSILYLGITNVGSGFLSWEIAIKNPTKNSITAYYNSKMCFGVDAQSWSNLSDVESIVIPANSSVSVSISMNYLATHVAVSTVYGGQRAISYGNQLNSNGFVNVMYSLI